MEQTRARAADDVGAAGKGRPPAGGADKENSHPSRSCDEGDATVRRRKGNSSSHNSSGTSSGRARRPASMTLESDESDEEEESGARAGGGGEDDFLDGLASRMMTLDLAPGAAQESRSGRKDRKNDSIKDHKLPQDAPGGARHSASGRGAPPEVLELPEKVQGMLYPHQVVGVQWLWSLQKLRRGGILADDMGLGKTMQVSAFLSGVLRPRGRVRRALIVAPKTLLEHWAKELRTCGLGGRTHQYFGGSQADRCLLRLPPFPSPPFLNLYLSYTGSPLPYVVPQSFLCPSLFCPFPLDSVLPSPPAPRPMAQLSIHQSILYLDGPWTCCIAHCVTPCILELLLQAGCRLIPLPLCLYLVPDCPPCLHDTYVYALQEVGSERGGAVPRGPAHHLRDGPAQLGGPGRKRRRLSCRAEQVEPVWQR